MAFIYGSVTKCKVRNGQTRNEYECRLGYQVNSQDIATNSSNVTLKLECRSINSSYATYNLNKGLTSVIDGTTVKNDQPVDMRNTNVWQDFGQITITVYHNPDGTYSASKTGSFTCTAGTSNYSLQSGSASVTVAPATIPRYANFTQHYVSKVTTSSITVYWNADASCDGLQCSLNGGDWFDVGGYPEYTLTGLAANTTYSIRTRIKRSDSQLWTESGTIYGTTYAIIVPTISLRELTVNSIKVSSGANIEASSIQYRIRKSGGTFGEWQSSRTFAGLSPNTTYIIEVYMISKQSGEGGSASLRQATYDYAKMTSAPNITIGENPTVGFSNPSGQTVNIYTENIVGGVAESLFTQHEAVTGKTTHTINIDPNLMYSKIPSATKGIIRYVIETICNGQNYYHWIDREYSINEAASKPNFNNFLYEDTNEKTVALTGNNNILVKDFSNLSVIIPHANRAIAQNYATMQTYRLNVGNMTSVAANYSDTDEVRMNINSINSASITVTAIDSRQLSTSKQKTAEFKAYEKPVITAVSATRQEGGVSDQVDLAFNGTWWNDSFGAVHNSIKSIEYYYRPTTSSTWIKGNTILTPTINGNYFSGVIEKIEGPTADTKGFDVSTAYTIKIIVTDELSSSTEFRVTLGTGTPAIAICNNKVAIGSKYDENLGGALQVKGEIIEEGLRVSKEEPTTKEKLWVQRGKNLFNKKNVFQGTMAEDGSVISSSGYVTTDFISVRPEQIYHKPVSGSGRVKLYYKDKTPYSTGNRDLGNFQAEQAFVIPADIYYIKFTVSTGIIDTFQLEAGQYETSYEEYVEKIIYAKDNNGGYEEIFNADSMKSFLLNTLYPVGSIYISTNNVSPATFFGGIWERLDARFLYATGDDTTIGELGGEAEHTLTIDEMPAHGHNIQDSRYGRFLATGTSSGSENGRMIDSLGQTAYAFGDTHMMVATNTGGGLAHNNMPPYLKVAMWKRVA